MRNRILLALSLVLLLAIVTGTFAGRRFLAARTHGTAILTSRLPATRAEQLGLPADTRVKLETWREVEDFSRPVAQFETVFWEPPDTDSLRMLIRGTKLVQGKSVLDVYSYIGGWGIQAAACGAATVCCLDSSAAALDGVAANAALNGLETRVTTRRGSAPESMAEMRSAGQRFDVVVLDPPAFIQRRKDLKKGITAYRRINELALHLLNPGGLLVSASCSMHLARADLMGAMQQAAVRAGCQLRVVEQGFQGPDHPIHPAIPETEYLKAIFARKT